MGFPTVVLTTLLNDECEPGEKTPEQKVVDLIRKEIMTANCTAFLKNDEDNFGSYKVQMRKDQGLKCFGGYEERTIQYDPSCDVWRIDHPTWFKTYGKYTSYFKIKKFEFGFDKIGSTKEIAKFPASIRIFPTCIGHKKPEERHILIDTSNTELVELVKLLLANDDIAGSIKHHWKDTKTKQLNARVESVYNELCKDAKLDYKGHPALRLVEHSDSTKGWVKDEKMEVYKDCYVRKSAKINRKMSEYGKRNITYNGYNGAWRVAGRINDKEFKIRKLSFTKDNAWCSKDKLAVKLSTNNNVKGRYMVIGHYEDGKPVFEQKGEEFRLLKFLLTLPGVAMPKQPKESDKSNDAKTSWELYEALKKTLQPQPRVRN